MVFINLIFLLSIVLLPAGNGLYGNYGQSSAVAMLYALHLTLIAALNAWLWWLVAPDRRLHHELAGAVFPLLVFLPGIALAGLAPRYAPYFWFLAFGGLVVRRFFSAKAAD